MVNLMAMFLPGLTNRFRVVAFWLWFPVFLASIYLGWWLGSMYAAMVARSVFSHLEEGDVGVVWGAIIVGVVIVVKIIYEVLTVLLEPSSRSKKMRAE